MLMASRYVNVTLQLENNIVLSRQKLHENGPFTQWSITTERRLKPDEIALTRFNSIMWDVFGIDSMEYVDAFAEMKRLPPILKRSSSLYIFPFIVKFKSAVGFDAKKDMCYRAVPWPTLVDEIMTESMYARGTPKHTQNAIHVAEALSNRRMKENDV